jgi:sugar diacid utilization regulator
VDSAALDLARPVGIDDCSFRAVAYSAQPDDVDEVRRNSVLTRATSSEVVAWLVSIGVLELRTPTRISSNRRRGMRARVCLPLLVEEELLGFFWLLDEPDAVSGEEIEAALAHANTIATVLDDERREDRRRSAAERELVADLICGNMAPDLGDGLLAMAAAYAVLAVRAASSSVADSLRDAIATLRHRSAPHHLLARVDAYEATVILATDDPDVEPLQRAHLLAVSGELSPRGSAAIVGVSKPRAHVHELADAYREASWAADYARRDRSVVGWDDLGAYRTILPLLAKGPIERVLPEPITRLLAARDSDSLMNTLEAYLESAGDSGRTCAALSLHRSSLKPRLRRIEEIAGVSLASGDARLDLHLGLRLWRLTTVSALADGR